MIEREFGANREIRRLSLRLARADLDDALSALDAAKTLERQAVDTLGQRDAAAHDPGSSDADVEAFAAWLPEGLRQIDLARAQCEQAEAAVFLARAALAAVERAMTPAAKGEPGGTLTQLATRRAATVPE